MSTYRIEGADRQTGEDVSCEVQAESQQAAISQVYPQMLVSSVVQKIGPRQSKPEVAQTPARSRPAPAKRSRLLPFLIGLATVLVLAAGMGYALWMNGKASVPIVGKRTGSVSGAAWIVRKNGDSNILRGTRVAVIRNMAPLNDVRKAANETVAALQREVARERVEIKADSIIADYHENRAREYADKASALAAWNQSLSGNVSTTEVLKHIEASGLVGMEEHLLAAITVKSTNTSIDGKFAFPELDPGSYLVHATLDTPNGYVLWAVPVTVVLGNDVHVDLFNDTSLVLKN